MSMSRAEVKAIEDLVNGVVEACRAIGTALDAIRARLEALEAAPKQETHNHHHYPQPSPAHFGPITPSYPPYDPRWTGAAPQAGTNITTTCVGGGAVFADTTKFPQNTPHTSGYSQVVS